MTGGSGKTMHCARSLTKSHSLKPAWETKYMCSLLNKHEDHVQEQAEAFDMTTRNTNYSSLLLPNTPKQTPRSIVHDFIVKIEFQVLKFVRFLL